MIDSSGPWVAVCFKQDDEYFDIADQGIEEMADTMSLWDQGADADYASTYNGGTWGSADRLYQVGEYVLAIGQCYASLSRRPLDYGTGA